MTYRAVFESPVGRLLIETDAGAIVKLEWTEEPVESDMLFTTHVEVVLQGIQSGVWKASPHYRESHFRPSGTPFQMKVWEALRKIPQGETRCYSDVAKMIGQPTATRAVASAIAKNPIALFNPCHRVIRADGSLGKFAWGPERKRALLEREGVILKRDGTSAST
jgi:O-6-methylguanine DNA methyltransferase